MLSVVQKSRKNIKWRALVLGILFSIAIQAEFNESFAHVGAHADSFESNTVYQICEPHKTDEPFDCLSFNKIAYHTNSSGHIIASVKDIVYVVPEKGQLKRTEMSSLVSINCDNFSVSVQLDPESKWTHWDYVKKGELIRDVMDRVCTLHTELASSE